MQSEGRRQTCLLDVSVLPCALGTRTSRLRKSVWERTEERGRECDVMYRAPATEIWPSLPPIDPVATQSFHACFAVLWHSETGGESFDVRRSYELVSPLVLCAPLCADVTAPGTSTSHVAAASTARGMARRARVQRPAAAPRGARRDRHTLYPLYAVAYGETPAPLLLEPMGINRGVTLRGHITHTLPTLAPPAACSGFMNPLRAFPW